MGNMFSNVDTAANTVEEDYVGGGGNVVDTGIYAGKIKFAYVGKSASSKSRNLTLCVQHGDKETTTSIWFLNRDGEGTYTDKKTKEKINLPGWNQVSSLCSLLTGKSLGEMDIEEKTLSLYDFDAKKEVPTSVDCFVELHGLELQVALQRQTVDKTKKNDNTGSYEPTGETRDVNEFIKFFPANKRVTLSELQNYINGLGGDFAEVVSDGELETAINTIPDDQCLYAKVWLEKHEGKTYDRSKGAPKGEGKSFKGGSGSGGEKKEKKSLFSD